MKTKSLLAATLLVFAACSTNPSAEEKAGTSGEADTLKGKMQTQQESEPAEEPVTSPQTSTDSIMKNPIVEMETSMGTITLELYADKAPVTVANFMSYVNDGFYDGTVFHRVISNFMIQGGGYDKKSGEKQTKSPIVLESKNGLSNKTGTIAMARTNDPNSASSQFFINVQDNAFLDYSPSSPGYAVFGQVIQGMEAVNKIKMVKTSVKNGMADWPVETVEIISVKQIE